MTCDPGVPKLKTVKIMERVFFRKKVPSSALNVQWRDLRLLRGRCADVIDIGTELPRVDQAEDTDLTMGSGEFTQESLQDNKKIRGMHSRGMSQGGQGGRREAAPEPLA